jgi:pilus assembly protein CpaB
MPVAIITSLLATFVIFKYLEKQKEKIENPKNPVKQIVVLTQDISIGTKITQDVIELKNWPEDIIPNGCFFDTTMVIGRVTKAEIFTGEPLLEVKLAPAGTAGGFSSIIPPGMRALTVSVDASSGVGGFILPNAYVDVLVTVPSPNKKEESSTKIILEDIKVLAVDQEYDREGDDPVLVQTVTLLVTPEQAEKLVLASTEGKLRLSLRNEADRETSTTSGIKLEDLVSRPRPRRSYGASSTRRTQPQPEPEPEESVVEIIRSGERSEVTFKEEKKKEDPD